MPSSTLAAGRRVGEMEFRRSVRKLRGKGLQLAGLLLASLFFGGIAVGAAWLLVGLSPDLSGFVVRDSVRGPIAIQWLFAVVILTQRVVTLHDRPDAEPFLLTTLRVPAVVLGLFLAELARVLAYVALPLLVLGGALAVVAGSPLSFVLAALVVLLFAASAVATAQVLGLAIGLAVARVPTLARNRTVIGVVAVVVFFGGYAAVQTSPDASGLLGVLPPGWLADLALLATPATVAVPRAVGAVVLLGGWAVAGPAVASRLATGLWLGDSVAPDVEARKAAVGHAGHDPLAAAIAPIRIPAVGARATRRIAQRSVLLVRRRPSKLSFLVAPIAVLATFGVQFLLGAASIPLPAVAPLLAVLVPWMAGAMFGLNPLGDEGRVLPTTLVSLASGRAYVHGLVLPALAVGLPFAVVPAVVAVATGYGPVAAGTLALLDAVVVVAATLIAPGIGFLFPRTEAVRVVRGRELVPPSLTAIVLYTVVVTATAGLAVASALAPPLARGGLAFLVGGAFAFPFDLAGGPGTVVAAGLRQAAGGIRTWPIATVRWAGSVGPVVAALGLGWLGTRLAARRFERYTM